MYFKNAIENFDNKNYIIDKLDHRLVYNFISANSINILGYENTKIVWRFILTFFFSISFLLIFKYLNLTSFQAIIITIIFFLFGQSFFSKLQIFKGFLAADFSYIFSLLSFLMLFKHKRFLSCLFAVFATYFHFLIGGYTMFFSLLFILFYDYNPKLLFKYLLFYLILVSPLFLMILNNNFYVNQTDYIFSADYIYSFIRHPHHLLPFKDLNTFFNDWFLGIIFWILSFFLIIKHSHNFKNTPYWNIYILLSVINYFLVFAFVISFFDTSYKLSKFYLFRPSSLSLFFSSILLIRILFSYYNFQKFYKKHPIKIFIFSGCLILFLIFNFFEKFNERIFPEKINQSKIDLYSFINSEIDDSKLFLIHEGLLDFQRNTGNISIYNSKFIPTNNQEIINWHKKKLFHNDFFYKKILNDNFNIDYIISKEKINNNNNLYLHFSNENYFLYKYQQKE